jgi:hypothetical protein
VQAFRGLAGDNDVLWPGRVLICDRDPKWSAAIEELLRAVGVRVVRIAASAPNCNQGIGNELIERRSFNEQEVPSAAAGEWAAFSISTTGRQHEWPAPSSMGHCGHNLSRGGAATDVIHLLLVKSTRKACSDPHVRRRSTCRGTVRAPLGASKGKTGSNDGV